MAFLRFGANSRIATIIPPRTITQVRAEPTDSQPDDCAAAAFVADALPEAVAAAAVVPAVASVTSVTCAADRPVPAAWKKASP